jgi:hypothetical protein
MCRIFRVAEKTADGHILRKQNPIISQLAMARNFGQELSP